MCNPNKEEDFTFLTRISSLGEYICHSVNVHMNCSGLANLFRKVKPEAVGKRGWMFFIIH